jgi:hypothetical protein
LGDSVYIGLPQFEVSDALWYNSSGGLIGTGSGIKVKPTQSVTQYIQAIDVCSAMRYDTMTVTAWPLGLATSPQGAGWGEVVVYPNPAQTILSIKAASPSLAKTSIVEMYNSIGQLVYYSPLERGRGEFHIVHA